MSNRQIQYWVIPPTADAEFVAHMESVLDTYTQPLSLSPLIGTLIFSLSDLLKSA